MTRTNASLAAPDRRRLMTGVTAAWMMTAGPARADAAGDLAALEAKVGGRLGVCVLGGDGAVRLGRRLDERFPTCSTFKVLLAGAVLARVDAGQERLDRIVPYGRGDLRSTSPVTSAHVGEGGLSVERLCEAVVVTSDNAGANLLLKTLGGPAGLTHALRALGDPVTRLDRYELMLNEAAPGDPRDTTTPRAVAQTVRTLLFGPSLSAASQRRLAAWMEACATGRARLRAAKPAGWRAGDKTGTGDRGSTNDVAVFWPPGGPPLLVAAYLTQCRAPLADREAALAAVGRIAVAAVEG